MIIPRFLLNATATLYQNKGMNGRGEKITELIWEKKCYVVNKPVKEYNNGVYTKKTQYIITIEKSDIKVGDILQINGRDIEVEEISFPTVRHGYMELIGYGKEK